MTTPLFPESLLTSQSFFTLSRSALFACLETLGFNHSFQSLDGTEEGDVTGTVRNGQQPRKVNRECTGVDSSYLFANQVRRLACIHSLQAWVIKKLGCSWSSAKGTLVLALVRVVANSKTFLATKG